MKHWQITICSAVFSIALASGASAGPEDFHPGTMIKDYGKIAAVDITSSLPKRLKLKVSFDAAEGVEAGEVNRKFDSLARFINMHSQAGVPPGRINVAMVTHSKAAHELTNDAWYGAQNDGVANANAPLIKALVEAGAKFYVCGQTAAYYGIEKSDLLPGVEMSLSAMTAHALLQQDGYTLNPF